MGLVTAHDRIPVRPASSSGYERLPIPAFIPPLSLPSCQRIWCSHSRKGVPATHGVLISVFLESQPVFFP